MSSEQHEQGRKDWTVAVEIDEQDGHVRARAQLRWRDQAAVGIGVSRLNPLDRKVAEAVTNESVTSLN